MCLDQFFFASVFPYSIHQPASLPDGYTYEIFRPRLSAPFSSGLRLFPFVFWICFHYLRIFESEGYHLLLIRKDGNLVHRSCIFPRYFRFPFMKKNDLQVGDTWTSPSERGNGLATWALITTLLHFSSSGLVVWYLCDISNQASSSVAFKAGMKLVGRGVRTKSFFFNLFGQFHLLELLS